MSTSEKAGRTRGVASRRRIARAFADCRLSRNEPLPDALLDRLDRFAIRLLDDAEAGCGEPHPNDTSTTEDSPGKTAASLSERVAALKAVTTYLAMRGRRG